MNRTELIDAIAKKMGDSATKKEAEAATEPTTDEKILTVLEEIRDQRKK